MKFIYATVFIVVFSEYIEKSCSLRIKREYSKKFNVLLDIYKMNPLSGSKVYKSLSSKMILPKKEKYFESSDSHDVEKEHLQLLDHPNEIQLQTSPKKYKGLKQPEQFFNSYSYDGNFLSEIHKPILRTINNGNNVKDDELGKLLALKKVKVSNAETFFPADEFLLPVDEEDAETDNNSHDNKVDFNSLNTKFLNLGPDEHIGVFT